jgi:hypothetical protein
MHVFNRFHLAFPQFVLPYLELIPQRFVHHLRLLDYPLDLLLDEG